MLGVTSCLVGRVMPYMGVCPVWEVKRVTMLPAHGCMPCMGSGFCPSPCPWELSSSKVPESNVIECFFIAFSPPLEGFLGPILFGFIRNPLNLCDIDLQRLIKKSGYHDEFVKFFSYEKRGENLKVIKKELVCRGMHCIEEIYKYV